MALTKVDQQERAIEDLTRVLSINPDHVNAAFARAACYNKIGQFVKAIEDYNFALMKDESNTDDANIAADAALSQLGDDFSSNGGTDSSRLAYQHGDGDVSPVLVPASRRQFPTSDSGGDISPLSNRSSGKFSQYHQYGGSPVSTPVSRPAAGWNQRGQDTSSYTYGLPPGAAAAGGGGRSVQNGHEGWAASAVGGSVSASNSIAGAGGGSLSGSVVSGTPARPAARQPNGALNTSAYGNNTHHHGGGGGGGSSVASGGAVNSAAPNQALAEQHHSRGYLLRKANDFAGAVAEYTKVRAVSILQCPLLQCVPTWWCC